MAGLCYSITASSRVRRSSTMASVVASIASTFISPKQRSSHVLPIPSNSKSYSLPRTIFSRSLSGLSIPPRFYRPLSYSSHALDYDITTEVVTRLLVGNTAPDFEADAVFDQKFIKVKLSEYIGKKCVVLFFYPLDFTFVCPTEITAFSDRYFEFENLNTEILGVSVDSKFSHLSWVQTERKLGGIGDLKYPLVSDVTKSISKSYRVLIKNQGIALRGLFIIDKQGVIQHSTTNNLAIGRSVDEALRTLQAMQFVQDNPTEVCPVGWQPGQKSMKPDPVLSKDYFSTL